MKKRMYFVSVILFCVFSFINAEAQVYVGAKGGLNVSAFTGFDNIILTDMSGNFLDRQTSDFIPSFHIGAMLQYQFYDSFFVQPEILYSRQGAKITSLGGKSTIHLDYLQVPVYGGYKYRTGEDFFLIGGIGPYFAFGMGGSSDFFDSHQRFDIGMSFMLGFQWSNLQFIAGYDWGFKDIRKKERNVIDYRANNGINSIDAIDVPGSRNYKFPEVRNQNIKLSVAYLFELD